MKNNNKSLFKWIGGKKWLQKDLESVFSTVLKNKEVEYYIEPFVGGLGSAIGNIELLKSKGVKKFIFNDVNSSLISTYNNLKDNLDDLFEEYCKIENKYTKLIPKEALKLNPTKDKEILRPLLRNAEVYFYDIRNKFNKKKQVSPESISSVALFLFLANHCYNGIYRENNSGGYNSPYNWECNIINKENRYQDFLRYSNILNDNDFTFMNLDVFDFMIKVQPFLNKSLSYFDPPYLNDKKPANKYNKNQFTLEDQYKLLEWNKIIDNCVFSNHSLPLFREFCENNNFKYKEVHRSNVMNSKAEKRSSKIAEILAYKSK
jgi:DNA adenine methylase